jgi:hypothetical protein
MAVRVWAEVEAVREEGGARGATPLVAIEPFTVYSLCFSSPLDQFQLLPATSMVQLTARRESSPSSSHRTVMRRDECLSAR